MSVCKWCGQEMTEADGCTDPVYEFPGEEELARIVYPESNPGRCHDCGVLPGMLHHPGCDMERCPRCGGQVISCPCDYEPDDDYEPDLAPEPVVYT